MAFWNRRRSIDAMLAPHDGPALKKTLGWPHLMALGVGAIVGTGILTLIGLMIVPTPALVLDAFFVLNIALSVAILMAAMNAQKPLDFSSFPSVLLFATLLRLSLNVA